MSTNLHFIKTVQGGPDIAALDVDNVFSDNFHPKIQQIHAKSMKMNAF